MAGFGWKYTLVEAVAEGESVTMDAPGSDDPKCDLTTAELAVGANVLTAEQFTVALADPGAITVTNDSPVEWPAAVEIYVSVPGNTPAETVDEAAEAINALQTQVAALQSDVAGLTSRVTALEAGQADLETRVAALENPTP